MKRIIYSLVLVILLAGLTLGCAPKSTTTSELPKRLVIGTLSAGSMYYTIGGAFSKVITDNTSMSCVLAPYSDTGSVFEAMRGGAVDFGTASALSSWLAYEGVGGAQLAPFLRIALGGGWFRLSFVVRANSKILKLADLKGKRIARTQTPTFRRHVDAGMANAGLTWDDVVPVDLASDRENATALVEGHADAIHATLGGAEMIELNSEITGGVRVVSADPSPEAVARMRKVFPGYLIVPMKAGSVVGVLGDVDVMSFYSGLYVHKDRTEQVVYEVVKALYGTQPEWSQTFEELKDWTRDKMALSEGLTVPYHPGAIKFYKEVKLWTDTAQKGSDALLK